MLTYVEKDGVYAYAVVVESWKNISDVFLSLADLLKVEGFLHSFGNVPGLETFLEIVDSVSVDEDTEDRIREELLPLRPVFDHGDGGTGRRGTPCRSGNDC